MAISIEGTPKPDGDSLADSDGSGLSLLPNAARVAHLQSGNARNDRAFRHGGD